MKELGFAAICILFGFAGGFFIAPSIVRIQQVQSDRVIFDLTDALDRRCTLESAEAMKGGSMLVHKCGKLRYNLKVRTMTVLQDLPGVVKERD